MTEIKCKFCNEWIAEGDYAIHIEEEHSRQIEKEALSTITKTSEQVLWILKRFPETRSNNGWLLEKTLQYFPFKNTRVIYDQATKECELRAPIEVFAEILKHAETITRLGRDIRNKHPELKGSFGKEIERSISYGFSRFYWLKEGIMNEAGSHEPDAGQV